jgi:hypothetical protein
VEFGMPKKITCNIHPWMTACRSPNSSGRRRAASRCGSRPTR